MAVKFLFLSSVFIVVQPEYSKGHHPSTEPLARKISHGTEGECGVWKPDTRTIWVILAVPNTVLLLSLFISPVPHHHLSSEAHEEQVQIHRGDATDEEGGQQPDI